MAEGYRPFPDFDSETVGQVLGVEPRPSRDLAHGDGSSFSVSDDPKTELEAYPAAGVARVTTEHARVELFRVPRYTVGKSWVLFEHGNQNDRAGLVVAGDGKVSYRPVLSPTESPTTAPTETPIPVDQPRTEAPSEETPASAERPTVTLEGRIGRDPWFSEDKEIPLAGFPLAINGEQGKTIWHNIKAQGDLAQTVEDGSDAGHFVTGKRVVVEGAFDEPVGKRKPDFVATKVERVQATKRRSGRQRG